MLTLAKISDKMWCPNHPNATKKGFRSVYTKVYTTPPLNMKQPSFPNSSFFPFQNYGGLHKAEIQRLSKSLLLMEDYVRLSHFIFCESI